MALFPDRIEVVGSVTLGNKIQGKHTAEVRYAVDSKNRLWVHKQIEGMNELLAESLGWLMAEDLGVPCPMAAIVGTGNACCWMGACIDHVTHWSATKAQRIRNLAGLGGILALDAIIGNGDRHAGNLLVRPSSTPESLEVFSIDLGDSWIGWPKGFKEHALDVPDPANIARGIPIDAVRHLALETAQKAVLLSEERIVASVDEACNIAREPLRDDLKEGLLRRCRAAPEIVSNYLNLVAKIT